MSSTSTDEKCSDLNLIIEERNNQKTELKKSLKYLALKLFILFLFSVLGGFLFRWAEGMKELELKCGVKKVKRDFLDSLWQGARFMKEDDWKSLARRRLLKFEDELHSAFEAGVNSYSGIKAWSFLNSIFYALTVMTTIGFGHISPTTAIGKILTILYAIVGIPLFTIIMVDAGKVFTRAIKLLLTRKNTKSYKVDEEFNLPLKIAFITLFVYSLVGTIFFYFVESEWGILGSFYFVFISTSTIGFGDLVPESPFIALCTSLYFLFGLALTSLCIGLVQENLDGFVSDITEKLAIICGVTQLSSQSEPVEQPQEEEPHVEPPQVENPKVQLQNSPKFEENLRQEPEKKKELAEEYKEPSRVEKNEHEDLRYRFKENLLDDEYEEDEEELSQEEDEDNSQHYKAE